MFVANLKGAGFILPLAGVRGNMYLIITVSSLRTFTPELSVKGYLMTEVISGRLYSAVSAIHTLMESPPLLLSVKYEPGAAPGMEK